MEEGGFFLKYTYWSLLCLPQRLPPWKMLSNTKDVLISQSEVQRVLPRRWVFDSHLFFQTCQSQTQNHLKMYCSGEREYCQERLETRQLWWHVPPIGDRSFRNDIKSQTEGRVTGIPGALSSNCSNNPIEEKQAFKNRCKGQVKRVWNLSLNNQYILYLIQWEFKRKKKPVPFTV